LPDLPAVARRGGGLAALALLLGTAACRIGTNIPEQAPPALELAEALSVSSALLQSTLLNSLYSTNHVSFMHSDAANALHSHPVTGPYVHEFEIRAGPLASHHNLINFDLTLSSSCLAGGSVQMEAAVTGEGNPAVQTGQVHYTMVQTHSDCVVEVPGTGGVQFVLNSAPYLSVEAHATNDGAGDAQLYGTLSGSIAWEAASKAGVCPVELAFSGSGASIDEIAEVSLSGSVCELTIDASIPQG
jgi:hypothetical protein